MQDENCQELLKRVCEKDQAAFTTVHACIAGRLFRYLLNQLWNPADAEEVFNDTVYAIWTSACSFRGESVRGWILGIAHNKSLERIRVLGRQPIHEDLDDYVPKSASEEDAFNSCEVSTFDQIAQEERARGIQDCMGKLKIEFREVLHLSLYQGLSYTEIATIQQVSEKTVKTRAFYARQKIRPCIERLLRSEGQDDLGATDGPTNS